MAADSGWIWGGTGEGNGHFQGLARHYPLPQETACTVVSSLAGLSGPVVTCKSGTPAWIWGAGPGSWEAGGGVAGGQTPDFPHSCLPALPFLCPTSSPLCSMTLFVCLQVPQAEEAPMGRDWSRRMSVEGRLPALPVYPHPNPLPWGLLDTPPHSLHPWIPEVQGSEGPHPQPRAL